MKREMQQLENQRQSESAGLRDRNDWISKYLELADKMIRTHMPQPLEQEEL